MKKIIIFIIFILLLCAGIFIYKNENKPDENEIVMYGNIDIRQVSLAFRVSGRLEKMHFEEGDIIQKNDLLASLDAAPYLDRLNQAKGELKAAGVKNVNAVQIYDRNIPLCSDGTVSKLECDNIAANKLSSAAVLETAAAAVAAAQTDFDDTKIYAPNDGTMLTRIQEPGAIVNSNTPVYTLSLTEPIWVRTYIGESDLGRIKLGMNALVYTDSNPKKPYKAAIGFISPVAEFTPKNVETTTLRTDLVYRLRVIISDSDEFLRQGMPVTVKVNLGKN